MTEADQDAINEDVENSPIVLLVKQIIEGGVRQRASDIHIEPLESSVRVRYRIDGALKHVMTYDIGLLAGIVTEELLNKQSRLLRLPLATVAGVAFGSIYSLCIEKPVKMPTPKTTRKERIVSTAEEIQQDIERLIDLIAQSDPMSLDSLPDDFAPQSAPTTDPVGSTN